MTRPHPQWCTEQLRIEPQAAREAKDARRAPMGTWLAFHIKEAPRITQKFGVWFDPNETEVDGRPKTYRGGPRMVWLRHRDFFMSDAAPLPERCHRYCEVTTGQKCHKCHGRVVAQASGISCPCQHTWFCW